MDAYELLLQPTEPGAQFDVGAVEGVLEARGATRRPDGSLSWPFRHEDVEVRRVSESGVAVAIELRLPLSEQPGLVGQVLEAAASVAVAAGVRVVDPHLNRTVGVADGGAVVDAYLAVARYAGEMVGVSGAVAASFAAPVTGLKSGGLLWVAVLIFVVAGWLGWRFMSLFR